MGSRGACLVALVSLLAMVSGCLGGQAPTDGGTGDKDAGPGGVPIDPSDSDQLAGHAKASLNWKELASMPAARRDLACALHDNKIWVVGGINEDGITESRVDVYDIRTQKWERGLPLPKPTHSAAAAAVEGELLIMGGYHDLAGRSREASMEVFGLSQIGFWTDLGPLPQPLAKATPITDRGLLLLVGGTDGHTASDGILLRSPIMQNWASAAQLAIPRVTPGAILIDDTVYVVGGDQESNNGSGEVVSLKGEPRRATPLMPSPRADFATATAGKYVYIMGGHADGQTLNRTDMYDAGANVWWSAPAMPEPTARGCAVSAGDGIHYLGGRTNGDARASHWVLTWL